MHCTSQTTASVSTDTANTKYTNALVDSGATREFIDWHYAKSSWFQLLKLSEPIPVFNIDGTPNDGRSVMEVVDLILWYKTHSEHTLFAVSNLRKQKLILRHCWLHKHNLEINWETREVKMSHCPPCCCTGCWKDARQEQITHKAQLCRKETCSSGPVPKLHHDVDDSEESNDNVECLELGNQIFASGLLPPCPSKDICASSTISTHLAEAFKANSEANAPSILNYLKKSLDVFSKESFDTLPEHKQWDHAIELVSGEKPASYKIYPLAPSEQKKLDTFLKENLETGWIHSSKSPMSSLVFFIEKKDGSLCLIQDYWALNAITVKNKYPLLLISKLVNKLWGARYFTKLNVQWGFNNIQMKDRDEWKATFCTNHGLFKPLVMFFGLTNSLATFQTMMDNIFEGLISEGNVIVYLDNILIFTETLEEHWEVVKKVVSLLHIHSLFLKLEKCEFKHMEIEYLRVIISHNSVHMDPVKVARVSEWPVPSNKKEVQSFLGFTNFYQWFIWDFSHHAQPLFDLTKNDMVWR